MTVHLFNKETKELINIKAAIYIPPSIVAPHKLLIDLEDDKFIEYDDDKYTLSYIGL